MKSIFEKKREKRKVRKKPEKNHGVETGFQMVIRGTYREILNTFFYFWIWAPRWPFSGDRAGQIWTEWIEKKVGMVYCDVILMIRRNLLKAQIGT